MTWNIIPIKETTKEKIETYARMNDDYDKFIDELIEHISTCDTWWENRYP